MNRPPIEDAGVVVEGSRVAACGRFREIRASYAGECLDLGEAILLPGLINAHCHLDYTGLAGQISPYASFSDWIKAIMALKAGWRFSEYAASWVAGARSLLSTGTTSVVDFEALPELLPAVGRDCPLRLHSLLEITNVSSARSESVVFESMRALASKWGDDERRSVDLAPHAPYSTTSGLLRLCADRFRGSSRLSAIHAAESREEWEMFAEGRGRLFEWLGRSRDDLRRETPVSYLDRMGLLCPEVLLVHANYVSDEDVRAIAASGACIVHCPRSHAYFGHERFRFEAYRRAGVGVCLGTDSLATTRGASPRLSLFAEMNALWARQNGLSPKAILEMATRNGAAALGRARELGEIAEGALADLTAVPCEGSNAPLETIVSFEGETLCSLINGRWASPPPGLGTDE